MELPDFLSEYDKKGVIVLLEGKREVKPEDAPKLVALGKLLASRTGHMQFRSGNAGGSDQLFAEGVASVDPKRLQVITPYTGHREKNNKAYQTYALDQINLAAEPEVVRYSKANKKTEKLIDRYVSGERDRFALKAAYIIRDTVKVLGASGISPASFGIFYDDLDDPMSGGTGHTMSVCKENNVPLIDQRVWFEWVG